MDMFQRFGSEMVGASLRHLGGALIGGFVYETGVNPVSEPIRGPMKRETNFIRGLSLPISTEAMPVVGGLQKACHQKALPVRTKLLVTLRKSSDTLPADLVICGNWYLCGSWDESGFLLQSPKCCPPFTYTLGQHIKRGSVEEKRTVG